MTRSRLAVALVLVGVLASTVPPAAAADPSASPATPSSAPPTYTPPSNGGPDSGIGSADSMAPGASASASGFTPALITNGTVQLGVNPEGHLNVNGGSPSSGTGTTWVGLRYVPTNADSTSPGCLCEGWGVGDSIGQVSGWASVANNGVSSSLEVLDFVRPTPDSAISIVQIKGPSGNPVMRVTHHYTPSVGSPNAYAAYVTIQNVSANSIDAIYRRVMDWDVEPTAFDEYVTFVGDSHDEPWLKTITNNGFDNPDPLQPPRPVPGAPAHTGEGTDIGPYDHGALFDFDFGEVQPGESVGFKIFYGASANEAGALDALDSVRASVYSFSEPSTDPATGTPNTFFFGFSRPDCADVLSASDETPAGTRPGKTNIKVSYDPRTLVDHTRADWAAAESGIASFIRTDMEAAFDRYQDLGLSVPSSVDVEIRCDLFLAIPSIKMPAPAVTEADNKIKIRTSVVQEAFRDALATWNGTGALTPTAYLQNAIDDHEPFHAIEAMAKKVIFTNVFDALTQEFGHDHTNWESGAVLGSDLMPQFDDAAATNYLGVLESLMSPTGRHPDALADHSALAYDSYNGFLEYEAASILQYIAQRSRTIANPERRSAEFLEALISSRQIRESGLREAANGMDPFDLLRDYFVTAWVRHGSAPDVSDPLIYRFLDETTPASGAAAPAAYPDYVVNDPAFVTSLAGAAVTTPNRTIKHGQGAIEVITLPAGSHKLAANVTNLQGSAPRLAFVPFNGAPTTSPTGPVGLRDTLLRVGPRDTLDQTTIVDASGFSNLAVVVVSSEEDLRYHINVRPLATLTPTLDVLSPAPGSSLGVRSPGLGEITLAVDPRVGGEPLAGFQASDFIVRIDGQPVGLYGAAYAADRYLLYVIGPGGLAEGLHDLSVEFRGVVVQRTGGLLVSSPVTDPGAQSAGGSLGALGQGQAATTSVTVAPGATSAAFTLAWQGSDFDLALTSPSGRVIDESTVASDVTVTQAPATVTITVAAPQAGAWQLRGTGVDVASPEPVAYAVQEYGTPMRAHALASGTSAGLPIAIRVPVHDAASGAIGAVVWASVTDPLGLVRRFPLTDDGSGVDAIAADGVYSTQAWGTDNAGTYTISVDVAATAGDGAFTRHETASVTLGTKIDTDGDGVADAAETLFGLDPSDAADGATDSDFDGLTIAEELRNATDPALADTDHGGEADGSEISGETNPRDRADDRPVMAVAFAAIPLDGRLVRLSSTSETGGGTLAVRRIGPGVPVIVPVPLDGTAAIDGPLAAGTYSYVVTLTADGVTGPPLVVGPLAIEDDVTAPMADLEINDGAMTTTSPDVLLRFINVTEPIAQMRIAASPTELASATWIPYSQIVSWQLASTPGVQRIYAQVRDGAGLESPQIVGGIELTGTVPTVEITSSWASSSPGSACSSTAATGPMSAQIGGSTIWVGASGWATTATGVVTVDYRLYGVSSSGARSLVTDWTPAVACDYAYDSGSEGFAVQEQQTDVGYAWFDIDARATAGGLWTVSSIRLPVERETTPPTSHVDPLPSSTRNASVQLTGYAEDIGGTELVTAYIHYRYRASSTGTWGAWTQSGSGMSGANPYSFAQTFGFPNGNGYYEFHSIAIDQFGNREAPPSTADATIRKR